MTSIVELFPKCRKLCYDARQQLSLQENNIHNNTTSTTSSSGQSAAQQQQQQQSSSNLSLLLEELTRQLDCMDQLVLRETPESRAVWKRKIAELRQEVSTMERKQQNAQYQSQRHELLLRRRHFHPQNNNDPNNHNNNHDELHHLATESQHWQNSTNVVHDLIQTADASYASLRDQRQRLRGVSRVVADMGAALGLTQTTMKIIERRDITDAYLIFAGHLVPVKWSLAS
jgi:golgi SNAP receptor complex member 2